MPKIDIQPKSLGFYPTPLTKLSNLSALLGGPTIYIKRDDLTGLALGGNKTRKLEYLIGDALQRSADTLVTSGAAQSNHCRQTAAAAATLNLDCHLLLGGSAPQSPTGNLLIDQLLGSEIHWCGENRKGEDLLQTVETLSANGKNPYVIPYGGSNEIGAMGYVNAMLELAKQVVDIRPAFDHILFASSSGGTQAGIMVGNQMLNLTTNVLGINIDKDESGSEPFDQRVLKLANATAELMQYDYCFKPKEIAINSEYIGAGYGVPGELEKEAIQLTARTEGILLDPVYTGRAMGALIDLVRKGTFSKSDRVLFWHTGGTPALFAYANEICA